MFGRAAAFFIWNNGRQDSARGILFDIRRKPKVTAETIVAQIVSAVTFAPCLPNNRKNGFGA
jgi:hypothetical protein